MLGTTKLCLDIVLLGCSMPSNPKAQSLRSCIFQRVWHNTEATGICSLFIPGWLSQFWPNEPFSARSTVWATISSPEHGLCKPLPLPQPPRQSCVNINRFWQTRVIGWCSCKSPTWLGCAQDASLADVYLLIPNISLVLHHSCLNHVSSSVSEPLFMKAPADPFGEADWPMSYEALPVSASPAMRLQLLVVLSLLHTTLRSNLQDICSTDCAVSPVLRQVIPTRSLMKHCDKRPCDRILTAHEGRLSIPPPADPGQSRLLGRQRNR